jgi:hypothetical protein
MAERVALTAADGSFSSLTFAPGLRGAREIFRMNSPDRTKFVPGMNPFRAGSAASHCNS